MKRPIIAAAALMSSTIMSTPALAATPTADTASETTTGLMAAHCDAYASSLGPAFSATVDVTDSSAVWGTEIGPRVYDNTTRLPVGLPTSFSDVTAAGASHLLRNGQSPNIFASDAIARTVNYGDSSADYTSPFNKTTTYTYDCLVSQHFDATPGSDVPEQENDCVARAKDGAMPESYPRGPGEWCNVQEPEHSGNYVNRLTVHVDGTPAHDDRVPESDEADNTITQGGQQNDTRNEAHAGAWTFYNQSLQVYAVVCISPSKNPGTWRAANLYGGAGGTCGYTLFQSLGTSTIPSNSLPFTG